MVHAFREQKVVGQATRCSRKQHGVITLDQARHAGMSRDQIYGMVDRGYWRRAFRAVFVDNGAPVTPIQDVVAASFASCGLASHRLCLWLWDLRPHRAPDALEFSVPYERSVRL